MLVVLFIQHACFGACTTCAIKCGQAVQSLHRRSVTLSVSVCVCVRAANLCGDFAVILKTLRVPRCAS